MPKCITLYTFEYIYYLKYLIKIIFETLAKNVQYLLNLKK